MNLEWRLWDVLDNMDFSWNLGQKEFFIQHGILGMDPGFCDVVLVSRWHFVIGYFWACWLACLGLDLVLILHLGVGIIGCQKQTDRLDSGVFVNMNGRMGGVGVYMWGLRQNPMNIHIFLYRA